MSLGQVSSGTNAILMSFASSLVSNLPSAATGNIISFGLVAEGNALTSGTATLSFYNIDHSSYEYRLFQYNTSLSSFIDSGATAVTSTDDVSFSVAPQYFYILVRKDNATWDVAKEALEDHLQETSESAVEADTQLTAVLKDLAEELVSGEIIEVSDYVLANIVDSTQSIEISDSHAVSNVPEDHNIAINQTELSTSDTSLPSNATGTVFTFALFDSSGTEVDTDLSIELLLAGKASQVDTLKLYVYDPTDESYSDSGFDSQVSGDDVVFTMTHFSTFAEVNESTSSTTDNTSDSSNSTATTSTGSSSSSGGGGGGCLLR
jgi:hypothetical protein